MPAKSRIQAIAHAGHACLQLNTRHGTAIVAQHGAQLLSWIPNGQPEVFWLSPTSRPEPAAIRGGVPICWPWFGKQGMPQGAMQHGPVRNLQWALDTVNADSADQVCITLSPSRHTPAHDALRHWAPHLHVSLCITLGERLVLTLETHNHGAQSFALTQALHSYFAVQDATQVLVHGLSDLCFDDKLLSNSVTEGNAGHVQRGDFQLDTACDRIYAQSASGSSHRYTLDDGLAQRRLHIHTEGSQSLVVWNPGEELARNMADVPNDAWRHFLCLEATNAGEDIVQLEPGGRHRLTQSLSVEPYTARANPGP